MIKGGMVAVMLIAACGDNLSAPDAALPPTCAEFAAEVIDAPEVGECTVDGVDLLVSGVSYRAADGLHTWIQRVRSYRGQHGAIVRRSPWDPMCYWEACIVERTPATGQP